MNAAHESIPENAENGRGYAQWAQFAFWLSELEANGFVEWAGGTENICRLHQRAAQDFQFGVTLSAETFIGVPQDLHWIADMHWSGLALRGNTLYLGGRLDWDPGMADDACVALGIPMDVEFVRDLVSDAPALLRICKMTYDPARGWDRGKDGGALLPFQHIEVDNGDAFRSWLHQLPQD